MSVIKLKASNQPDVYYEFDPSLPPLGEGGMGRVYRGRCISNGHARPVAIKCLKEDVPQSVVERARREAGVRVKHDNLVEMIDFVEVDDVDLLHQPIKHYHVVSELLMGVDLNNLLEGKTVDQDGNEVPEAVKLLKMKESNPYAFAHKIVSNILQGLIALHAAGYIHRDLDPTNLMITQDGAIKVIDYGITKKIFGDRLGNPQTSLGQFLGKPSYASPELIMGDINHQDATTDLYAVGVILYHMLVGQPPFSGPHHVVTKAHMTKKFPMGPVKQRAIANVILKACAKNQSARYQSAAEFLVDLQKIRNLPYPESKFSGNVVAYCLGGLGAAALVLGAVLLFKSPKAHDIEVATTTEAVATTKFDQTLERANEYIHGGNGVTPDKAKAGEYLQESAALATTPAEQRHLRSAIAEYFKEFGETITVKMPQLQ